MWKDIMVFTELRDGRIHEITYELLNKGREMADKIGWNLSAIYFGEEQTLCEELIYHGADQVYRISDVNFRKFIPQVQTNCLKGVILREKPSVVLFGATRIGRTLASRLAASLRTGLTADCIGLDIDNEGNLIQTRPAFTGNILATILTKTRPQMCTVRYRVFERARRDTSRVGEVIDVDYLSPSSVGMEILERKPLEEVNLPDARIIVSGGRGFRRKEDLKMLKELAELLGGEVGASRPLVDEGWIGREHQVGFSGNTVKPDLYMAFGISGSPQHLAGMRDSKIIVAVNKDPTAPISRFADYYIVADLYEILPRLISKLRELKKT